MRFLPKYYSLPSNIPSRELHRLPPWGGDDPEKCLTGRDFITVLPTDGSCRASLLKRRAMLDIYPRTVQVKELDHLRTSRRSAENPCNNSVMVQCKHLWHESRGDGLPTHPNSREILYSRPSDSKHLWLLTDYHPCHYSCELYVLRFPPCWGRD
ncbi:hypothetical protein SCLCIDRAFT_306566 [Scleroderma citrinum Foug A]|uniref:Uncharacterized protein n=1 Tax=Scleroderma citrinum Foug A TaxID=1036808 RepID=A0A0C3DG84_9AGAM|nr:hypothetical protein SCLCIDRAFT_306566 [Scleroderma citrinum Foug A]